MARASLRVAALALAAFTAGCATEFEGERPSSLYGQHTDAAVALYGPWDEALNLNGQRYYLWRRSVETDEGLRFCELRLEVTERNVIARRLLQGYPDACQLFAARFVAGDRN
ncbi:hypothetical protein LRS10_17555 [Phenylobacterium sp. J426]|uniref:hypothetical protein n=1 Tax=Phenylobacterium sp. J426 TaxID=2898439 RepID=UPI00215150EF|nr:hypothetical protein [Phenylobacterium sp. J426]MCR5875808.1 hypothetical protein [Phenylobacterium sp. J426]